MQKFEITNAEGGSAVPVKLTLNAATNKITQKDLEAVYIDLSVDADPEAVDHALTEFLAKTLEVSADKLAIASGKAVDKKVVIILSLTPDQIEERLSVS
ncbi:MAG: DUF167 family protein [Chloroflexota bacterium]